jgi:hypothetical protein
LSSYGASANAVTPEYLLRLGVRVSIIPIDGQSRGETIKLTNDYLILINESLSDECKWKFFMHELGHIIDGDFDREEPVDEIERRR